jgi:hypothetical protein
MGQAFLAFPKAVEVASRHNCEEVVLLTATGDVKYMLAVQLRLCAVSALRKWCGVDEALSVTAVNPSG